MFGTLYIVATPIGNLGDITIRAIETLGQVDLILAEDTRVASKLLSHLNISKDIISYHQQSDENKKLQILASLLQGKNIALITDAGTPGISDPGGELIQFLLEKEPEIKIVPIPGPSSLTTALSASGIRANEFLFLGFLPKKGKTKIWEKIQNVNGTTVFFESPHRIIKTLEEIKANFGEVRICVARELTKIHETFYRGTVSEVITSLNSGVIKGEIVVILDRVLQ